METGDAPLYSSAMTAFTPRQRPIVLCVLDGWGHRAEPADDDAIRKAGTPNLDRLARGWPVALLEASELHVGLPPGQMGNSEVGHMNLGAGRVVMQDLPRIDQAIADGSLDASPALREFAAKVKHAGGAIHLMGLLSPGGVHSHQDHVVALARAFARAGLAVRVHAFLDGRDTPPKSAEGYLRKFLADVADLSAITIATVSGRYWAMDRDRRWERIELAYQALVDAEGERAPDAPGAVAAAYARGESDEFVRPTILDGYGGMRDGDGVAMANFRADRARQILSALLDPVFSAFARRRVARLSAGLGMAEYSRELNRFLSAIFPPAELTNVMGELVARAGLKQLRIAETEKYAHVTFFFNGGEERRFSGEQRILVPSPRIATYDLQPEMSANELTDRLLGAIESGAFDFIVVNYANTDMVGHTGDFAAAKRAVETVDLCLGRVADAVLRQGGALMITADHGNAEMMVDPETGQPHTAHTTNPVPVMLIGAGGPGRNAPVALRNGKLADVAPTLLELLGLPQPAEMTGRSLIAEPSLDPRLARATRPAPPPPVPRTERPRGGLIALGALVSGAFALAGSATAQQAPTPDKLAPRLESIERSLDAARQRKERLSGETTAIAIELAALNIQAVAAAAAVQTQEAKVSALEDRIEALDNAAAAKGATLDQRRSELAGLLSALVRLSRMPPEALLVMPDSPADTARRAMLLGATVPQVEQRAAALRRDLDELAATRDQLAQERESLGQATAALSAEQLRLAGLIERKIALQRLTEAERRETEARLARLSRQATDIRDLINRLVAEREAEERRRREAAERAEQPAPAPAAVAAVAPAAGGARLISRAQGALVYPVRGRIVAGFGHAANAGPPVRGLTLETRPGAQVVAPFEGQVAYAGLFRTYGLILIIEHGEGYHTLLAGFGRIDAAVGQWVAAGEPVGSTEVPGTGTPKFYLELRRNGQPIDPLPWLAAPKEKVSG